MLKKLFNIILLSALCCCFWSCGSVLAAEITEQELSQLEINLNQLEVNNRKSQEEVKMLKRELTVLTVKSENQQKSLQTANESLKQYEKEMKAKLNRTKMQRNLAYGLVIYLLIQK